MQNAVMPNVTIRNLSPEAHQVLVRRAAANGQSLQQYLVHVLEDLTARPTMQEWVAEVEGHVAVAMPSGPLDDDGFDPVAAIHHARKEQDAKHAGR